MNKLMKYKGFHGSVSVSMEDNTLFGKIECINDVVTYEAESPAELKLAFEEAVVDYLETCEMLGKEPEKPLSGTFNIRIGADLHKKAYLHAKAEGISLNDFTKSAIEHALVKDREVHMHLHMPSNTEGMSSTEHALIYGSTNLRIQHSRQMELAEDFPAWLNLTPSRKTGEGSQRNLRLVKSSEERFAH